MMTDEQTDLNAMKRQLKEWRRAHPNATFREMEQAVEEQVAAMRAAMLQEFCDLLCPDAVRILDFPHAVQHLSSAAQAAYGPGTPEASAWLGTHCSALKQGTVDAVVAAVKALPARTDEAREVRRKEAAYLTKRAEQMAYDQFMKKGYPIYFHDGKPAANHPWKHQQLPHSGAGTSKTAKT